ncbi:Os01g0136050, partial [Oryza sativa Japonica Group]
HDRTRAQHDVYSFSPSQPEISMAFTSGFLTSALGTVTVSTPFSMLAFTWSTLAFSGSLNRRMNCPLLRSTRCHLSFLSSFSLLRCPLITSTLPSSTSTFTSSFLTPGRSALKTCDSGVSFQSTRALAKAAVSRSEVAGTRERKTPSKGSQKSAKGSNTLLRLTSDIVGLSWIASCLGFFV